MIHNNVATLPCRRFSMHNMCNILHQSKKHIYFSNGDLNLSVNERKLHFADENIVTSTNYYLREVRIFTDLPKLIFIINPELYSTYVN